MTVYMYNDREHGAKGSEGRTTRLDPEIGDSRNINVIGGVCLEGPQVNQKHV